MVKKNVHKENTSTVTEFKLLGRGHNGEVYLLPNGKVIKLPYNTKSFTSEYKILERVNGNQYFPKIYEVGSNYMIRDYVEGEILPQYIKTNGLSRKLVHKIIKMLKEFTKLKFKKIDIRCKDIFVQPDGNLKIIDPKKYYSKDRDFPRHLSKGLHNLGVLDFFLEVLREEYPNLYKKWGSKINEYIASKDQ